MTREYDSFGRLRTEGWHEDGGIPRWEVSSTYDGAGRLQRRSYPQLPCPEYSEPVVDYAWDPLGRLETLTDQPVGGPETLVSYTYRGAARKVRAGSGDPVGRTYEMDELGRLIHFKHGTWNGVDIDDPDHSHAWKLDELGNWREHKEGDDADFRSNSVGADNAYTSWEVYEGAEVVPYTRTHDAVRGFLTLIDRNGTAPDTALKHDALGRLVEISGDMDGDGTEVTVRFGYATSGQLAWRWDSASAKTIRYVHAAGKIIYEIREESDGSTQVIREHVWAGSTLVRSKHRCLDPGTGLWATKILFAHQDRLGSVVLTTNDTGMSARNAFDPYGRQLPSIGGQSTAFEVPYGFAGARWDEDAQLYLMGHRWYDPEVGRFVQQDPIGEKGGLNLYAYVGSSPTMWVDPTGLSPGYSKDASRRMKHEQKQLIGAGGISGVLYGSSRQFKIDGVVVTGTKFNSLVERSLLGTWPVGRDEIEKVVRSALGLKEADKAAKDPSVEALVQACTALIGAALYGNEPRTGPGAPQPGQEGETSKPRQEDKKKCTVDSKFGPGGGCVIRIVVDNSDATVVVEYGDGKMEEHPAAVGDPSLPGATDEAEGTVTGTAWGPISNLYENTQESYDQDRNPNNPYGPAIILVEGTDGRHIHGTTGPINDDTAALGGDSAAGRRFTHGCARLSNKTIIDLKADVDRTLAEMITIRVGFQE